MMRFVARMRWSVRAKDAGSAHMLCIRVRLRTPARAVQRGLAAQGSSCWSLSNSFEERVRDQAVLVRVADRLGPVGDAETPIDVRQVELHRLPGEPELLRDLLVGEAPGESFEHPLLARRQAGLVRFPLARGLEAAHGSVDGTLGDEAKRGRKIAWIDHLSDERLRSAGECRGDRLGV